MKRIYLLFVVCAVMMFSVVPASLFAQEHSVAMQWNETQLNCIRKYFAKPTVHARNLFHASIVMYDMWAVYDQSASTFFLGKTVGGYTCPFNGISQPADIEAAREKAISYAMYRYVWNRYTIFAPPANLATIQGYINAQMTALNYDPTITSTDYSDGDPAKLGNYIAARIEEFALGDGSNQANNYANVYYQPINGDIWAALDGNDDWDNPMIEEDNSGCYDPNRWQEMSLVLSIDQQGNPVENAPPALSHEWGNVVPFALTEDQKVVLERDGHDWPVYLHQGPPPFIDVTAQTGLEDPYKWGFVMNIVWHSLHNEDVDVMKDISPASLGNNNITQVSDVPDTFQEMQDYYDFWGGGDNSPGYSVNPVTGLPYEPQLVPRGDYSRVLSQFWADGPNSETPPGHWFTLINYVANHDLFEKRWEGVGEILPDLEWDVKAYFALGGAIHDAAVTCWSHKGYYDYTRPIMAIRYMGDKGQSTDSNMPHYHPAGLPLIPGYIELVGAADPLVGVNLEHLDKIKLWSWRGPDTATGLDGPGWLLSEDWWTYQVNTFVTPPFSGYFSGHSTFSRSGAEALTLITGDPYFPGGMGEFTAPANTWLTADDGPSMDVTLQWATYRDASDQCSISRIFGGLHPPQDDLPGRKAGLIVGPQAFAKAETYFDANAAHAIVTTNATLLNEANTPMAFELHAEFSEPMNMNFVPLYTVMNATLAAPTLSINTQGWIDDQHYAWYYTAGDGNAQHNNVVFKVSLAQSADGEVVVPALSAPVTIDTLEPSVSLSTPSAVTVNDAVAGSGTFTVAIDFSETMNTAVNSVIVFTSDDPSVTLTYNAGASMWSDNNTFLASFTTTDAEMEQSNIDIQISVAEDTKNNVMVLGSGNNLFVIDTKNPSVESSSLSTASLTDFNTGAEAVTLTVVFDEEMNTSSIPGVSFPDEDASGLSLNTGASSWSDPITLNLVFDLSDDNINTNNVDIQLSDAMDIAGNMQISEAWIDAISVDTENPVAISTISLVDVVADTNVGSDTYSITITYDQDMDINSVPVVTFPDEDPTANSMQYSSGGWVNATTYEVLYNVEDEGEELWNIDVWVEEGRDAMGNDQVPLSAPDLFDLDTRNPVMLALYANTYAITESGTPAFWLTSVFDETMDEDMDAVISFPNSNLAGILTWNSTNSGWLNSTTYEAAFNVADNDDFMTDIDVNVGSLTDLAGNPHDDMLYEDFFNIALGVGVSEFDDTYQVTVYPNPVSVGTDISVYVSNADNDMILQLFDVNGKMISEQTNEQNKHFIKVNTSALSAGMYFVTLLGSAGQATFNVSVVK